jgi:hypothetical protein
MSDKIRIRFPNELWWDEISYDILLKCLDIRVTYSGDSTCFVLVTMENGQTISLEMIEDDYKKIVDKKVFMIKFDIDKHVF